ALEVVAAGVIAHALEDERALSGTDPWSRRDGWRLHGAARRRFDIVVDGTHHVATLERTHGGAARLATGGRSWRLAAAAQGPDLHDVTLDEHRHRLTVYAHGERLAVFARDGAALAQEFDPIAHAADAAGEGGRLTAPMPGKVIAFLAQVGESVRRGQPLAVMEAMKMEHTISAPRDGVVEELLYGVGDQVVEGGELLRLADEA
ncbi:MAG TPA: biotin/lipoyl-containing protein, partial [Gemmatimonadales bacterium]|nr:biotin/lipoyl-containing protein [Gemmatimonadales bacterium]